jgi:hypothetical protein
MEKNVLGLFIRAESGIISRTVRIDVTAFGGTP